MPARPHAKPRRKPPGRSAQTASPQTGERLQRIMSDAGLASRRTCELLIEEGRVSVNGRVVRALPAFADARRDRITVDGIPIPKPERRVYLMLNKPSRTLSTSRDEPGAERRTVVGLVNHPAAPRLFPVGRLDFQTTGLVLLTNDGDLANRLTHPRYGVPRTYHALIKGALSEETLGAVERGIRRFEHKSAKTRPGEPVPRIELAVVGRTPATTTLAVTLVRGPVQELSRLLRSLGCSVKGLERVALGPLTLRGVARGQWRELDRRELGELRRAARASGPEAAAPPTGARA